MTNRILLLTLTAVLLAPMAAQADMYLGASVGNSWFNHDPKIEDVKKIDENSTATESGTDFIWGLGAGVRLGPVGVRLEWESMEVQKPDNLTMLSLGATLGF